MSATIADKTISGVTNRVLALDSFYIQRTMNIPYTSGTTTKRASAGTSRTITTATEHSVAVGDFISVLGMGDADYNCTTGIWFFEVTGRTSTTITYTGSGAKTEGETADTGGRWLMSKWKTLRIGMRVSIEGDATITGSANKTYFGLNIGTGTPACLVGTTQFLGLRWKNEMRWNSNRYDNNTYDVDAVLKVNTTETDLGNFANDSVYIFLCGANAYSAPWFMRYTKNALGKLTLNEEDSYSTIVNSWSQAHWLNALKYNADAAYPSGPAALDNKEVTPADCAGYEDPAIGPYNTFEFSWPNASNTFNICELGWAVVL